MVPSRTSRLFRTGSKIRRICRRSTSGMRCREYRWKLKNLCSINRVLHRIYIDISRSKCGYQHDSRICLVTTNASQYWFTTPRASFFPNSLACFSSPTPNSICDGLRATSVASSSLASKPAGSSAIRAGEDFDSTSVNGVRKGSFESSPAISVLLWAHVCCAGEYVGGAS